MPKASETKTFLRLHLEQEKVFPLGFYSSRKAGLYFCCPRQKILLGADSLRRCRAGGCRGSGLSSAFPPSLHPVGSVDADAAFHDGKGEILVFLTYDRSCSCARTAAAPVMAPCHPWAVVGDTAAGKVLFLGKGLFPMAHSCVNWGPQGG